MIGVIVMLDRKVVRELLDEEFKETEAPDDIFKEALLETFCNHKCTRGRFSGALRKEEDKL